MKIRCSKEIGSVLMMTLVTAAVMGVGLASYLGLVRSQNISTMKSLQWNAALPLAEAGIEEALVHLNTVGTNSRVLVNNWWPDGTNAAKWRPIGNSYLYIWISGATNDPIITCYSLPPDERGLPASGRQRKIKANTTNEALFAKGIVAKGVIDIRGNNIRTDSFDSSDPLYSTGGRYDVTKSKDNGDIATNSGLVDSLNIGNAEIYGKAKTGPGGTVTVGSNGGVGTKAWLDAGNHGVQSGRVADDMNISFKDVKAPFNGGASPVLPGIVDGTNYTYVLNSGNYEMSSLTMSGSNQKMVVTGPTTLFVRGDVSLTGQSEIIIAPGGSLNIYVEGETAHFGGNGVVNQTASAFNFAYWGLPSNRTVRFSGNASYTGTIYAPQADFQLGGGGSDSYDFVGAAMVNTVHMNGHFKFHYDEALAKWGPRRGYVVTAWNEVNPYGSVTY